MGEPGPGFIVEPGGYPNDSLSGNSDNVSFKWRVTNLTPRKLISKQSGIADQALRPGIWPVRVWQCGIQIPRSGVRDDEAAGRAGGDGATSVHGSRHFGGKPKPKWRFFRDGMVRQAIELKKQFSFHNVSLEINMKPLLFNESELKWISERPNVKSLTAVYH